LTPSAQVIEAIRDYSGYFDFAFAMSQAHTQSLQSQSLHDATQALFANSVQTSLQQQAQGDAADAARGQSLEDFVAAYYT